ncbi:hypothetical protein O6H91_22G065300 [Diphasiastrum complanatum]|uniref:Uncharacterized protein n=1 Tax=Diphasiastrum complanatum TaxID=34168 RepID=A0ACC2AGD3_DIPCM|nr:hypothetical protein O6H91_22G065300 [Diphasiastrum complanatum]
MFRWECSSPTVRLLDFRTSAFTLTGRFSILILLLLFPSALVARERQITQEVNGTKFITIVCMATQYPEVCISSLSAEPTAVKESRPKYLIKISIHVASKGVRESLDLANRLLKLSKTSSDVYAAASECSETLNYSIDWLNTCNQSDLITRMDDIKSYLSAALTYQNDCYSALQEIQTTTFLSKMMAQIKSAASLISNSLSMLDALDSYGPDPTHWKPPHVHNHKKGPFVSSSASAQWIGKTDSELLEQPLYSLVPSVTVSTDGLANFTSIQAAVDSAPANATGNTRYIIYIKEGIYNETVRISSKKTLLMFMGDGINKTIITGNRSVANQPNMTTFDTATVGISGAQFLARDLTFENTAGPSGHQAVSLRVESDKAAFYRCSFLGYQDTLYAHVLRQFYRECVIEGTIDFIFGNAAVVFQNCDIRVRVGRVGVTLSTITAQGRTDPAQATGFVLQNCTVNGTEDYIQAWQESPDSYRAFLGRPWKAYSTTIFMQTYMEALIEPQGWLPWNGTFALSTLFYGEYNNSGPGSNCSSRVTWSTQLNLTNVQPYSVQNFIQGSTWLPLTNFSFTPSVS